jgi:hypothetical protein
MKENKNFTFLSLPQKGTLVTKLKVYENFGSIFFLR